LTWTAGALLIVGLVAGTVLSVVPDGMVNGAAPVATNSAEPAATSTPTPSEKPKATKESAVPGPTTLRYPSCNDVWAGGQGPFKEGEPGYTRQLYPDGDGIACESRPK
jgi:hypothetical protein